MSFWMPYILAIALCANAGDQEGLSQREVVEIAPESLSPRYPGDQITLKSGKTLHGVRILRETPRTLVLEVFPGVEPLLIPVKQVTLVERGTTQRQLMPTPAKATRPAETNADSGNQGDVLSAVKVSAELLKKMAEPFTSEPIAFQEQDIVNVLRTVSILSSVPVTLEPTVEQVPAEERRVTVSAHSGASVDSFLREELAPNVPWLRVEFRYDRLHFSVRNPAPGAAPAGVKDHIEKFRG